MHFSKTNHIFERSNFPNMYCIKLSHAQKYQNTTTIERHKSYKPNMTRGVSHCGLPFTLKKYFKAKKELMETQMFQHAKTLMMESRSK
jgi:hypothetical protein